MCASVSRTVSRGAILILAACGSEIENPRVGGSSGGGATASSTTKSAAVSTSVAESIGAGASGGTGGAGGSAGAAGAGGEGPWNITVFVYGPGAAGVTVAVNDATGAVVQTKLTDVDGLAHVYVPPDGLVATYPPEDKHEHYMQAVVAPPEGSTVSFYSYGKGQQQQAETKYDVASIGYPAGTATIEVRTCNTIATVPADPSGTTTVLADDDNCSPSPGNTVLVIARDAAQAPLAWGRMDVLADPGGVVPVSVVVDQPDFLTFTETIAPLPDTVLGAGFWLFSAGANPPFYQLVDNLTAPGPSASWSLTVPTTPMQFFSVEMVSIDDGGYPRFAQRSRVYDALPVSATLDPTVLAPVLVDPPDATDPVHPETSWTVGAGLTGEIQIVELFPQLAQGNPGFIVYAPAGASTTFRLPDVPPGLPHFDLDGPSGPPTGWDVSIGYMDDEAANDWASVYLFQGPQIAPYSLVSTSGSWSAP